MTAQKTLAPHPLLADNVRLRIMGLLVVSEEPVSFSQLLEVLELSKGNLSTHVTKLEEERLVEVKKQFVNKKPLTTYSCTKKGREELNQYLVQIQNLLEKMKSPRASG